MLSDRKKNLLARIFTAIVGLPVYIFAIYTDCFFSLPVLFVSLVITLFSLYEYYKLTDRGQGGKPFMIWGILAGAIINIVMYLFAFGHLIFPGFIAGKYEARIFFAVLVVFLAVILIAQLFFRPINGGSYSLAVTLFGVIYIVFFFSHIILMKALQNGFLYILIINIVVMLNDSAAYFGGVAFGKHKTNFAVSPNKSWEGYCFGLLVSIIAMIAADGIISYFLNKDLFSFAESVILGILFSIFGNLGDLIESVVKRDASKKDSGSLWPGHGGMWDVFDALIFSFPIFYYYLILKGIG